MKEKMNKRIIRLADVIHKTGMCRASIYKEMAENRFPKNVKLTSVAVGWIESEIDEWIESRILTRNSNN
ncbi:AlpA family transcriptional regulator [Gilliamella sp. B2923]|nr:AlpA family transcriptional regulator [Gilliamella sp. B2923]QYN43449.1 AlpA family transcriptional regulator [Gilliamella sp. ESL0441]